MKVRVCPFCNTQTNAEVNDCVNCLKVINSYRPNIIYKPKLKKDIQLLTLNDFKELIRICVESITGINDSLIEELELSASDLLKTSFTPSLKSLRHTKTIEPDMEKDLMSNLQTLGYFWALINYFLGVEYASKRISEFEASKYIQAINFPFAHHLIEFSMLAKSKAGKPENIGSESDLEITNKVLSDAKVLFTRGSEQLNQVKPKVLLGELTAFSIELKQIKIG